MKISLSAGKLWRVLAWALAAAAAPLFAQTDDHGNTALTASVALVDQATPGILNTGGDVDYFRFTLSAPAHVSVFTTGATDTVGSLRTSGDAEISSDDNTAFPNFRIEADLAAGTYYVRVSGANVLTTGSYTLNIQTEQGNVAAAASPVSVNSTVNAAIGTVTDVDYYSLSLTATTHMIIYSTGTLDTVLSLRNGSDQEIVLNDDGVAGNVNFRIDRELTAGTYYLKVTAKPALTGSYLLHVESTGKATVTTGAVGGITDVAATFNGTVVDDAASTITQRGIVYGTSAGPLINDSASKILTIVGGVGPFVVTASNLTTGTHYYARAFATNSTGTTYGADVEFTTTGTTTAVDDHGDTFTTATVVGLNSATSGQINFFGDADYFKIELPAPSDLFVITSGTTDTFGTLYDSLGTVLATADNNGTDINFRFEQSLPTGTYYIAVRSATTGTYLLTVQATVHAALPTVVTNAVSGVTMTGATFAGTISADGGATVTQRGFVYGTSSNPIANDGNFTTLPSGNGSGTFTLATTALQADTHYYVRTYAVNSSGISYGSVVEFSTPDDHGNTAATATAIALNANATGGFTSAGDVDYFRFVLTEPLFVSLFTTGSVHTAGSLRDSSDTEIARADSGGSGANFRLERLLQAGAYYLRLSRADGALGDYTLRVETSTFPTVTTTAAAEITPTSALFGGNVASEGGTSVTRRGLVYSLTPVPTLTSGTVLNTGAGPGGFSARVTLADATTYYVRAFAMNSAGVSYGSEVQLTTPSGTRLVNMSIRARAGEGEQALLVGFTLGGEGTKPLLLRGIGPTLGTFGVTGALPDPFLQLFSPLTAIASNEDWGGSTAVASAATIVGAFPLPAASKDAAMLQTLSAGTYSLRVGGGTGAALVEVYDAGGFFTPELVNVSTRSQIGTGSDTLIAGFTITGTKERTILIRGIGPTLGAFGVTGVVADPRLDFYRNGSSTPSASNDNWEGNAALAAAFKRVGAFDLPVTSRDAALLLTLSAGSYTVQVSAVGNATGVALLEIYELP